MKPILLLGDSCTDKFVYCQCERLCPESPVPLLDIKQTVTNRGMAGNVLKNLLNLNCDIKFITNKNYRSILKTRYVDHKTNHMFIRIDTSAETTSTLKDYYDKIDFDNYSAVVMSDYCKGFLTKDDIEYIGKSHPLTFLDTKKKLGSWANNITYIKINRKEYNASQPTLTNTLKNKIITTLGSGGATYKNDQYDVENVEVKDLSGAGDTFLAGLVYAFLHTKDITKSIIFANKCATCVVQKQGVSVVQDTFI